MTKFVIQLLLLLLTISTTLHAAPCTDQDKPAVCLWDFLKVIAIRDQLPDYVRSALQEALIDKILLKHCGQDVPSQTVIIAIERAVKEKIFPSCIIVVLKSIKPCEGNNGGTTQRPNTGCCSTNPTSTQAPESTSPTIPGTLTTVAPTTYSPSTHAPKPSVCDKPNCDTVKDKNLSYPSTDPNKFYRCSQNAETKEWKVVQLSCEAGRYFNYVAQYCTVAQPTTNICEQDKLPPVFSTGPSTTLAPSTSVTSTAKPTVTTVTTTAPSKPTKTTLPSTNSTPSFTKTTPSTTSPPSTTTKATSPNTSPTKPFPSTTTYSPPSTKTPSPTSKPTPTTTKPTTTTKLTTTPKPTTTTSKPITTTRTPYWKIPGFESSRGSERVWWVPTYLTLIFDSTKTKTSESYAALFQAMNELIERISSGKEVSTWTPAYLLEFPKDILVAFNKIKEVYKEGIKTGDYDFKIPAVIQQLIIAFKANNIEVQWEVVDAWKTFYSNAFATNQPTSELYQHLQSLIGTQKNNGVLNQTEVDQFSTYEIAEKLVNAARNEREKTNNLYYGPYDHIINVLIGKWDNLDGANRLVSTHSEIEQQYNSGKNITNFIPATLVTDLQSYGLSPEGVKAYLAAYYKIREIYINKNGSVKKWTTGPGQSTETKWYSPDPRLQAPYQKLIDAGRMDDLAFDTLGRWVDDIVAYANKDPSLAGYDSFVPANFKSDLDRLNQTYRQDYEQSFYALRELIKSYRVPAIKRL